MFMLYAIGLGLLLGLALGGQPSGLGALHIRWAGLALAGLALQLVLFAPPVTERIGDLGVPFYVGSSAAVLLVVLRNLRIPGVPLVALGAASNLVAIVTNGGWMPASPSALASLGATIGDGYSNSRIVAFPAVAPLTDVFAMPAWMPLANVFSLGDVLIGVGVTVVIVVAMRGAGAVTGAPATTGAAGQLHPPTSPTGTHGPWPGTRIGP